LRGEEGRIPDYLIQVAYNPAKPQNRIGTVRSAIEALGGSVERGFAFGEGDVVAICEMPDNAGAAAFVLAVGAGGTVSSYRTTVLLRVALPGHRPLRRRGPAALGVA
jgi:uncharacterized protein with GYD domain